MKLLFVTLLMGFMCFLIACKTVTSDTVGTKPSETNERENRTIIYYDVKNVALPIFETIVKRYDKNEITNNSAKVIAERLFKTFENMSTYSNPPIHPLAFFAAVKDFETADSTQWSKPRKDSQLDVYEWKNLKTKRHQHNYFKDTLGINTTKNCFSKQCLGNFQVDVIQTSSTSKGNLHPNYPWEAEKICGSSGGLGIAGLKGGMDFCSAFYWWMYGLNGHKCKVMMMKYAKRTKKVKNPCVDDKVKWSYGLIAHGRNAYVQAVQPAWENTAYPWGKQYLYYENILLNSEKISGIEIKESDAIINGSKSISKSRLESIRQKVCEFKKDIGFEKLNNFSSKECDGVDVFSSSDILSDENISEDDKTFVETPEELIVITPSGRKVKVTEAMEAFEDESSTDSKDGTNTEIAVESEKLNNSESSANDFNFSNVEIPNSFKEGICTVYKCTRFIEKFAVLYDSSNGEQCQLFGARATLAPKELFRVIQVGENGWYRIEPDVPTGKWSYTSCEQFWVNFNE